MFKPSVLNILLFWFVKYIIFYVLHMFKTDNYTLVGFRELKTGEDWFLYLWMFLFLPVICSLIFTAPMYYSFKVKNVFYFVLIIVLILVVEYILYTWLASQADLSNGIYNGAITLLLFHLFFFSRIKAIYQ
jgi:hypothetical protein